MGGSYEEPPDKEANDTAAEIEKANKAKAEAEAEVANAKKIADDAKKEAAAAKKREEEAIQREKEAKDREAEIQSFVEAAKRIADQAQREVELAKQRGEISERQERAAKEKEAEAKRLAEAAKQATLSAQKREDEANARVRETQARIEEAQKATDEAHKREEILKKDLKQKTFYLDRGIQPEVWPTEEEFQRAKDRIEYDTEKLHFAVCGGSGSGKSSLVNAFRGLRNGSPQAARAGVVETTMAITRYPDLHSEPPFKRLVWFDCPGAGTLEIPGWQYFNQQGLFIFDIIILVYDSRFTQIDVSIIKNCERFKIPLFIVRSKASSHIQNIMQDDLGYDENNADARENFSDYQAQARQLLIDTTKKNLETNLTKAELVNRDVFIVSRDIIYSLVTKVKKSSLAIAKEKVSLATGKEKFNLAIAKLKEESSLAIDEERLIRTVLTVAHDRRYGSPSQEPFSDHQEQYQD